MSALFILLLDQSRTVSLSHTPVARINILPHVFLQGFHPAKKKSFRVLTNLGDPINHIIHSPQWDLLGQFVGDFFPNHLQCFCSQFWGYCIWTWGDLFQWFYSINFMKNLKQIWLITQYGFHQRLIINTGR